MRTQTKVVSFVAVAFLIFFTNSPSALALTICDGRPAVTLTWSSSNSGSCASFTGGSAVSACDFASSAGGSKPGIPNNTSCTATISCWSGPNGTGTQLATQSATLTYDPTLMWNAATSSCIPKNACYPAANPANYGAACTGATSAPNACGTTSPGGTGTIQCNGTCSGATGTTPANPAGYGNACTSAANSCGQTNTGTIGCTSTCSATTPSNTNCGACGSASGIVYPYSSTSYAPYAQCSSGTASNTSFPAAGSSVSWNCSGVGACSASRSAPGAISVTLTASPAGPLTAPGATTLSWTTTGTPDSCVASNYWSGTKTASGGSELRSAIPASTQIFDITCSKAGTANATASVSVTVNASLLPTASFTVNGVHSVTVAPGDTLVRTWSSTGGTTWSSTYVFSGASCASNGASGPWSANTASGSITNTAAAGNVGCTTTITYTVTNSAGSASDTITVITAATPAPTGTLTLTTNPATNPVNCVIASGASTCTVSASWNTSNVSSPALVDGNTETTLSTSANSSGLTVWVAYTQTVFNLKNSNTVLDTKTATASCTSGTAFDGDSGSCQPSLTNGSCTAVHYSCFTPAPSTNNVSGATSYTWTCPGSNGGAPASCSENKTLPDLTAGSVTPTSATAGVATTLSATISNSGTGSTGAVFNNLFQKATDASGTGATDIGPVGSAILSAGGVTTISLSYTFAPSDAYHYIRVCADKSSLGDTGAITEPQASPNGEFNNCGAWTNITVSAAPCANGANNPPTCTTGGGGGCLNNANNPPTCTTCTAPLIWNGSSCVTPASCSAITIGTCDLSAVSSGSSSGSCHSGYSGSCNYSCNNGTWSMNSNSCTVPPPPSATISANPTRVHSGTTSAISWSASNVTSCTVTDPSGNKLATGNADNSNAFSKNSPYTATITGQSTYTIDCKVNGGSDIIKSVTVNIMPAFQEF